MYTNTQKKNSSFSPISTQKKSNGFDGSPSFSAGTQLEINSSSEIERPSYSRNAADALIANVMPSMEAREQGEAVAGQKDQGAVSVAEVVMPVPSLPIVPTAAVSQPLGEMGIQRQCSACEQGMEEGKDSDEMSSVAGVQTKLTVGAVGDKYEQEADRVAAQVMRMSIPPDHSPQVQRFGEEDNPVQMWSLAQSITPVVQKQVDEQVQMRSLVQRAFQAGGNEASGDLESRLNASKGGGSALAPEVRAFMEPRFGADFSSVRVHTDSTAVQMNKDLGAQAFAHGSDIYYGSGKSPGNNELTAHELTHTIQQGGAVRLNKEVRRQPKPVEEEKQQLQRQKLSDRIPETAPNKELRLQPIEEQEEAEPLQAKQLGDRIPETAPNKELRLQPLEEQEEAEPLQAKQLSDRIPETSPNKELRLQPLEQQEEAERLQAKELGDRTAEVSPNKELRLQPIEEQEEQQPLQAKEFGDRTPQASSNKELRLQPIEEQEEQQPLQAKQLPGHNPELSFNKELQRQPLETANPVIQAKALEGGFTPSPLSIQRGFGDLLSKGWNKTKDVVGAGIERGGDLLSKGKDLLKSGLDWVKNNIIQPLMSLASSGWSAVKNFGSQISTAFQQANPTIWDVFQPEHMMFLMASNQRKQLYAQAIQAERSQQAQAAAGIQSSGLAPVTEPSQLERLNGLAETIESGAGKVFDVKKEILEGAVVGDFNENPTIWNTIGQVAIGFVPYAGQVADIRDIVANVKKLHETGYKDPDAWINLVLTGIGIIPGVGDAIKAVGKGSKGVIRKALSSVLKNADNILRPVLGKAKGLLNGAGRYGKQFLGWASGQGAKLLQGVKGFAQKTANFAKAVGQRARGLVTALHSRIGGFVNSAMQKASAVVSQGRGLMGKAIAQFMGMAQKAFDAVQSRVSQAVNLVKAAAERGKDIALKVGRKIADTTQKATTLLREFTQSAIQKGRQAVQKARQWSSQQIKKATELGRRLVTQARKRVADLVRKGIRLAKEKALAWIKQKIRGIKQRILDFLKDRWNRLKEKLGIKKPGKPGKEGAERSGKETTDNAAKKAAELPAAIAQAKAITEANDAVDTPVPALIGVLNASVKSKYSWIKRFEARPKAGPSHYSIHMIASDHEIDPDYTTGGGGGQKETLLKELAENGVKHNADDIIRIARGPDGKIVFLEKGNSRAGLQHIIEAHADDFARRGVPQDQIPDLVMTAVTEGKIVGSQGKGRASGGGRAIYEVTYGGKKHYVAVSVGNNGFIVGANPASPPSL